MMIVGGPGERREQREQEKRSKEHVVHSMK
jgi:hypothetical protein